MMNHFEYYQQIVDCFIELYGDRIEGIGDDIHAGFAWIGDAKFVLFAGAGEVIQHSSSWRRLSRLLGLAQQFRQPILLWDVPFQVSETPHPNSPLLTKHSAQNSQLQLLKLPLPILRICDRQIQEPLDLEVAITDAAVFVKREGIDVDSTAMGEPPILHLNVTENPLHIKSGILKVLDRISKIPIENLIQGRMDRIRRISTQSR